MKFLEPIDSQIPRDKTKSIGNKNANISKLLIDSQIPREISKTIGNKNANISKLLLNSQTLYIGYISWTYRKIVVLLDIWKDFYLGIDLDIWKDFYLGIVLDIWKDTILDIWKDTIPNF